MKGAVSPFISIPEALLRFCRDLGFGEPLTGKPGGTVCVFVISMQLSVFFLLPYKKLGAWGLSLSWLLTDCENGQLSHSSGFCFVSSP